MPKRCRSALGPMPDSCEHLDRADRAGREDHLAAATRRSRLAVLSPAHARRAGAVEHNGFRPGIRSPAAGWPPEHGLEEAARRRPAAAAPLVDVEGAAAFVVAGIEVGNALDPGLLGRRAKCIENVPAHPRRLDPHLAAHAVCCAGAEKMVLVLAEERQHVVAAPAGKPELAPMVVIGGLPAHIDHGVDRGGAADHLAARIVEAAAVEPFLRLGLEHPVRAGIADGEQIADRDVEPDPVVLAAGLQQQHAHGRIGGQAICQHAAGRAGADDDVVVFALDRLRFDHCHYPRSPHRAKRMRRATIAGYTDPIKPAPVKPDGLGRRHGLARNRNAASVRRDPWRAVSVPLPRNGASGPVASRHFRECCAQSTLRRLGRSAPMINRLSSVTFSLSHWPAGQPACSRPPAPRTRASLCSPRLR